MKGCHKLFVAVLVCSFLSHAAAQSITYSGFECMNPSNGNDLTSTNIPKESIFEVVEKLDGGMFRLKLTGGLPRFAENDSRICIDSHTALGFIGTPESVIAEGLPLRSDSVDATGYFNGYDLIIVISSIYTDLSQSRGTFSSFNTSRIQPITNTLFFEYNNDTASFRLNRVVHNRGFVQTTGSTGLLTPFIEIIVPSFTTTEFLDRPLILIPSSSIIYRLE